jgi:phosphate/sulfate permease
MTDIALNSSMGDAAPAQPASRLNLTYAQGASAELVAASTIGVADVFGLPVSTTHVLSSGVAGTMAANRACRWQPFAIS